MPVPIGVAEVAVQHRHAVESLPESLHGLRREADFRHQHDRLPARGHHALDRLDVNFGLAAAGYAVDQHRLRPLGAEHIDDGFQGLLLILVELQRLLPGDGDVAGVALGDAAGSRLNQPLLPQRRDRRRGDTWRPASLRPAASAPARPPTPAKSRPAWREASGRRAGRAVPRQGPTGRRDGCRPWCEPPPAPLLPRPAPNRKGNGRQSSA